MSFQIGPKHFDKVEGEIMLPKRSTYRYSSPASPHAGVQVLPSIGPPFTLQLTRFNYAVLLNQEIDYANSLVGQIVALRFNGTIYEHMPYRLRFNVLDVQLVETDRRLYVAGSRAGVHFEYDPAAKVVANYTFQAVPL